MVVKLRYLVPTEIAIETAETGQLVFAILHPLTAESIID